MYESPINLIEKQVAFDIEKTIEGEVWKVTKEIGVDVNREELIKALQYDRDQYERGYCDGLNAHKWISVSERLPEEETDVLICNEKGDIELSRGSYSTEVENDFIWYTSGWRFGKVIAWMPLPKPYKAESEE